MTLYHQFDALTNTRGDSLPGYRVIARLPNGGAIQPIYGDINGTPIVSTSGIANTAATDNAGNYSFFITANNTYDLEYYTPDGVFLSATRNVPMIAGIKGDKGDTGSANSTYPTLALMQAADISNATYNLAAPTGSDSGVPNGPFVYRTDGAPYTAGPDTVALNGVPLTTGALVRQTYAGIAFNVNEPSKTRRLAVDLDDFPRLAGEADYSGQASRACAFLKTTNGTLRLQPKYYPGAVLSVHGTFDIEGNGARIERLSIGTTIVGGTGSGFSATPTAWTFDADGYAVSMFTVSGATKGASVITLGSAPTFAVGSYLFFCGEPASNSSDNNGPNYIPRYFEFSKVIAISGTSVTLQSPLTEDYTNTKCRAFYTDGLAINCRIRGLTTVSSTTAYQYSPLSAINVRVSDIIFAGKSAIGASTFTDGYVLENWLADGAFSGISTARGTRSAIIRNGRFRTQATGTPQYQAVLLEESFYDVLIDNVRADTGFFSIQSLNHIGADGLAPATRRRAIVLHSRFDMRAVNSSPFQCGAAIGADVVVSNTMLAGTPITPDATQFPGITGSALTWVSSNATGDVVSFDDKCTFIATTSGAAFKSGTAGGGRFLVSEDATFITATVPDSQWTPRGPWAVLSGQMDQAHTPDAGGGLASPAVRRAWRGRDVVFQGAVKLLTVTDGYQLTQLGAFYRPASLKTRILQGFGGGDGFTPIDVTVTIATNGIVTIQKVNGATALVLDGLTYPADW